MRNRAGCTEQNSPHQKEEAEELQGRYRPLRVPSSEGPRLALRCDSVLEPLHTGLVRVGHVRAPTTHACVVRLFASSRIRCPRPWKCGSKWRCQWEPLVEEFSQKDGQRTNQLGWPARSGAGLLPAPKRLEERFRQWARRSSPLNPAQGLLHLLAGEGVPLWASRLRVARIMTCLTGASSTQGVIGSTTNPNQVLIGESAVFFQESGTPSASRE